MWIHIQRIHHTKIPLLAARKNSISGAALHAGIDGGAFTTGMSGVHVCALPEIEFYRRMETVTAGLDMAPEDVKVNGRTQCSKFP
jgi:hypothetical protein